MTDEPLEPVRHTFGWCQSYGADPDQYHALCHRTYRSQFGVNNECDCPNHDKDTP